MFLIRHRHDHFHHYPDLEEVKVGMGDLRDLIIERFETMSKEMDDLTVQVRSNNDLVDSATTLINGIAARIDAAVEAAKRAGADPADLAQMVALSTELKQKDETLAAAVKSNTPMPPPAAPPGG